MHSSQNSQSGSTGVSTDHPTGAGFPALTGAAPLDRPVLTGSDLQGLSVADVRVRGQVPAEVAVGTSYSFPGNDELA